MVLLRQPQAPDIKLTHVLGDVQGREAFYAVYRAAVTGVCCSQLRSVGRGVELVVQLGQACCSQPMHMQRTRTQHNPRIHPPTHPPTHQTGLDYKLRIIDIVLDAEEGKAACWVDLNLKIAPLYLKRYHAPTLVMLSWRRDEDGL